MLHFGLNEGEPDSTLICYIGKFFPKFNQSGVKVREANVQGLIREYKGAETKPHNKTISNGYADIDALVCKCWQKGCSFRLLSALLRTKRYDTIYGVLIRSKAFPSCKRSRPSRDEQQNISEIPLDIISAMERRKITARKWCRAYGFEPGDLWYRSKHDGTDTDVAPLLKEDFPEIFSLELQDYKTAAIGCDRKGYFGGKKGRYIIWSRYFSIRVEHRLESEALRLYNWRKNQVIIKRRLQLFLEKGIEAAMAWPPSDLIQSSEDEKMVKRRVLKDGPEEEVRKQNLFDSMQRSGEISSLIRKLAAFPRQYLSNEQIAQELQIREKLVKKYEVKPEQIDNSVKNIRWKDGLY